MLGEFEQESALAKVVENKGREDENKPGNADGPPAEMAHVGVEGLPPRYAEHHGPENHQAVKMVGREEIERIDGVDGQEYMRVADNVVRSKGGDGEKPDQHDRAEHGSDAFRSTVLEEK